MDRYGAAAVDEALTERRRGGSAQAPLQSNGVVK